MATKGNEQVVRVMLLGAPGCGKGTQALCITDHFKGKKVGHLSTGDLLRQAVAAGTDVGKQAKAVMDRGELVSDDIVLRLIEDELNPSDSANAAHQKCADGFILDGFPRNVEQAERLEALLEKIQSKLDAVLFLEAPDELIVRRICGRRIHAASGRTYHIEFNPPKQQDKDDVTGEALIQRQDDNEETLKRRLQTYKTQTSPLIDFYTKRGILKRIDASKSTTDVTEDILRALRPNVTDV